MICDISGVFRKDVTDDLIDGIIAFFIQSIEYRTQNPAHILFVIAGNSKLNGIFCHGIDLLECLFVDIISQTGESVKSCYRNFSILSGG